MRHYEAVLNYPRQAQEFMSNKFYSADTRMSIN